MSGCGRVNLQLSRWLESYDISTTNRQRALITKRQNRSRPEFTKPFRIPTLTLGLSLASDDRRFPHTKSLQPQGRPCLLNLPGLRCCRGKREIRMEMHITRKGRDTGSPKLVDYQPKLFCSPNNGPLMDDRNFEARIPIMLSLDQNVILI